MAGSKLTTKEQEKAEVLTDAIAGKITNAYAAKQLGLSIRQVQRRKAQIRKDGLSAVVHQLKGKQSNHRYSEEKKATVINTIEKKYPDFKPSFATEKLAENHAITISRETTRLWMIEKGLWKTRKQRKKHTYRAWRPRKACFGELQQFDGSYHYWFEDRFVDDQGNSIEVCLLASIDDATGKITKASFAPNEGVGAVFTFWKEYVQQHGKPLAMYLDKFSTYKINHKSAVDNHDLMTQFERAMKTLGIQLIFAHSPQAKGRIERLFDTLQDRLVKELRLANIKTPEQGNIFLTEVFIPNFNKKFAVSPAKEGNLHKSLSKDNTIQLHRIFSVHSTRTIHNDFTIQFKNIWYQLAEIQPTTLRPKEKISVEEWLDGTIHFSVREYSLKILALSERPMPQKTNPAILTTHKLNWQPPKNHPWKTKFLVS